MIYVSSAIIGILLLGVQVVAANKPSDAIQGQDLRFLDDLSAVAYRCDEKYEEPIEKESSLRVCVEAGRPTKLRDIYILKVSNFNFVRTDKDIAIKQDAIDSGAEALDRKTTILDCKPGSEICVFQTFLDKDFFESDGVVEGVGSVAFQHGRGRRYLADVSLRGTGRRAQDFAGITSVRMSFTVEGGSKKERIDELTTLSTNEDEGWEIPTHILGIGTAVISVLLLICCVAAGLTLRHYFSPTKRARRKQEVPSRKGRPSAYIESSADDRATAFSIQDNDHDAWADYQDERADPRNTWPSLDAWGTDSESDDDQDAGTNSDVPATDSPHEEAPSNRRSNREASVSKKAKLASDAIVPYTGDTTVKANNKTSGAPRRSATSRSASGNLNKPPRKRTSTNLATVHETGNTSSIPRREALSSSKQPSRRASAPKKNPKRTSEATVPDTEGSNSSKPGDAASNPPKRRVSRQASSKKNPPTKRTSSTIVDTVHEDTGDTSAKLYSGAISSSEKPSRRVSTAPKKKTKRTSKATVSDAEKGTSSSKPDDVTSNPPKRRVSRKASSKTPEKKPRASTNLVTIHEPGEHSVTLDNEALKTSSSEQPSRRASTAPKKKTRRSRKATL